MEGLFDQPLAQTISVFAEVVLINLVLSGDNAIVVGMVAAALPPERRLQALWLGIGVATILRIVFAAAATTLLHILGLLLAGGLLLLWVAWKLWREVLRHQRAARAETEAEALLEGDAIPHVGPTKPFGRALWQIIVADVSMSLDNTLAVAGAAFDYPILLMAGLATSVLLMGLAAAAVAKLLDRHHWIAYCGLAVIVYIALKMIWMGSHEIISAVPSAACPLVHFG
jgi:YjbE family integral membrane protein